MTSQKLIKICKVVSCRLLTPTIIKPYILRVKQEYNTGAEMITVACRKKRSKLALVSLSPLFLVVFVVGWIIAWIGQLGH